MNSSTTLLSGALSPQSVDLTVVVNLVVLEHGEFDLPVLMLDLFGSGVILLLGTSPQPQDQVKSRLLLDIVVGQGPSVLKLLTSKDKPLLVRRNALLVLDLSLYIFDGVTGLHLKGDGFTRQPM